MIGVKYQKHQLIFVNLIKLHTYSNVVQTPNLINVKAQTFPAFYNMTIGCSLCYYAGTYSAYTKIGPLYSNMLPSGGNSCKYGRFLQQLAMSLSFFL